MRRFFWRDKAGIGQSGIISGADARHIRTVLRMRTGEHLAVFDGAGNDYEAEITAISPEAITVSPLGRIDAAADSPARISIAQAMLKGKKMDVLARQVTELGMTRWIPFLSERSIPMPDAGKASARLERWHLIAIEALKQCQRSRLTEISPLSSYEEALKIGQTDELKLIFWEEETRPLQEVLAHAPDTCDGITAILGPEGGFSRSEVERAVSLGYQSVSLGSRILKAETATVSVCTLMQYLYGDMGRK